MVRDRGDQVLARLVNNANRALIELKRQLHAGEPDRVLA
jgi:hypothetical protein